MKTAMQEWFDELKANYPYMANEIFDKGFNKYLEKEKEQIIDAFEVGYKSCDMDEAFEINRKLASGELHYNQTYNQNK
jgi:hypothetical protein